MCGLSVWNGFLSDLLFCRSCRDMRKVRLGDDIGVVIQWIGDVCFFKIHLIVKGCNVSFLLYVEMYRFG